MWFDYLRPASFRGAQFHVETGGKRGGRRNVTHEFPKRDDPYAEDMGRRARRWTISAYVIGDDYADRRDDLIDACEQEGPGLLVHPTIGEEQVVCDYYHVVESRERGRMAEIEMQFTEAGQSPSAFNGPASASGVNRAADTASAAGETAMDEALFQ